jgi:hypothetical protein
MNICADRGPLHDSWTCIGFIGPSHGQTDVAPNGVELRPVIHFHPD